MAEGLVVLQSYIDSINLLPEDRRWPFFVELYSYRVDGTTPDLQSDLEHMAWVNILPVIDASVDRYTANKENGQKGGRPKKWIEQAEAERLYRELKSWDKVAETLDVSRETLRKARFRWYAQKPKNQDKDIDSDMDKDTDKDILKQISEDISKKENKEKVGTAVSPSSPQSGSAPRPMMPGYEWVRNGVRYRINDDGEAEMIGKA